jgi:hypothetical protein
MHDHIFFTDHAQPVCPVHSSFRQAKARQKIGALKLILLQINDESLCYLCRHPLQTISCGKTCGLCGYSGGQTA